MADRSSNHLHPPSNGGSSLDATVPGARSIANATSPASPLRDATGQPRFLRSDLNRAELVLQFCFAAISCLGGLVLASGPGSEAIPIIAITFALFGFIVVDRFAWFHLPPIAAYVAMGLSAVYCVRDFWDARTTGNEQMVAVALLLVLVQAILMLQRKTPRIFEQIGVFCLLQLVVGAVSNDAIHFGLLLVPIGILGAMSLSVMSSITASEGIQSRPPGSLGRPTTNPGKNEHLIDQPAKQSPGYWRRRWATHWMFRPIGSQQSTEQTMASWSSATIPSLASASARLQRFTVTVLAPAVLLVTAIFFYALPRTTEAARLGNRGNALVGFDDEVRLDQFGQMLQNSATALRIKITDRQTGKPYLPSGEIYLRGKVLEKYEPDYTGAQPTSTWRAVLPGPISGRQRLPLEYVSSRSSDKQFYDAVDVQVSTVAMQQAALFAVAPYHVNEASRQIVHAVDRWTIARKDDAMTAYAPIEYGFGTNAFFNGKQSDIVTRSSTLGRMMSSTLAGSIVDLISEDTLEGRGLGNSTNSLRNNDDPSLRSRSRRYRADTYLADLTEFDTNSLPTLAQLSRDIVSSIPPHKRTTLAIAKAFERHLAIAGGYRYSLNLDATIPPGIDPIEQFVSTDKRGHCQYFASAMAMMLRSANIPARLVVGYRTSEYNDLGQYFVARQLHAHAWVEALIDRDQIDKSQRLFGQAPSSEYWIRLDPTPGDSESSQANGGNVDQVMDMAEKLWEKYVVSMDSNRQRKSRPGDEEQSMAATITGTLTRAIEWVPRKIKQLRSGNLSASWPVVGIDFSWQSAGLVITLAITLIGLAKLPWNNWTRLQRRKDQPILADKPSVAFYAEALELFARLGITRRPDQTPNEFLHSIASQLPTDRSETEQSNQSMGAHPPYSANSERAIRLTQPMAQLTSAFYQACYAVKSDTTTDTESTPDDKKLGDQLSQLRNEVQMILKFK